MNELIQQALTQIGEPSGMFDSAKTFVEARFGTAGVVAAGLLIASVLGLILSKAVKMSFDVVRYVAVPAVAVSFIGTYFLPYSFVFILPVTVAFFSIILIVKG